MRKTFILATAALCCLAATLPGLAFEFSTKGDLEWRYIYWARTGNTDIFGQMGGPVDLGINHLSTFPTSATTNRINNTAGSVIGVVAGENRYGSDMNVVDYRMTLNPKIKVNPAIDIEASMNFTSLGVYSFGMPLVGGVLNPPPPVPAGYVNSLYVPIQDRPANVNVPNTFVTLQWLKLGIKSPWMDFSLGYKTSGFGMGLWKNPCNRSSTSFGMTAKYGPLKINFSPYFAREQSTWNVSSLTRSRNEGAGSPQRHDDRRDYFLAAMGEISYSNGPLVIQLLSDSYRQKDAPIPTPRGAAIPSANRPDENIMRYRIALAVKYFNGRFFFNGEADWFNRWRSGRGTANPSSGTGLGPVRPDRDDRAWLYGFETGTVVGPNRVTLSYVRATGNDPTTRHDNEDAASAEQGASACFMKQWGYLMYYMYGTGDGWDAAGWGQPTNFHHAGIRFDHAIASNLNIFGVYSYAWRDQPNAYTFGGNYGIQARLYSNDDLLAFQNGTSIRRPIPDHNRHIGWEVDLGLNWKLLENLSWNTTVAYWKPGNWWGAAFPNTAAIYTLNGGTAIAASPAATAANEALATTNFNRGIDPLIAFETNLLVSF
ncbi:MAG: alginate export family protein [Desulfomonile sp.]|nr:alginate export family protein [Desulfomonile sp.]